MSRSCVLPLCVGELGIGAQYLQPLLCYMQIYSSSLVNRASSAKKSVVFALINVLSSTENAAVERCIVVLLIEDTNGYFLICIGPFAGIHNANCANGYIARRSINSSSSRV